MSIWRTVLTDKNQYVVNVNFDAMIMKDQYQGLEEYAKACCNNDINLALQKALFFGINNELEEFAKKKQAGIF